MAGTRAPPPRPLPSSGSTAVPFHATGGTAPPHPILSDPWSRLGRAGGCDRMCSWEWGGQTWDPKPLPALLVWVSGSGSGA